MQGVLAIRCSTRCSFSSLVWRRAPASASAPFLSFSLAGATPLNAHSGVGVSRRSTPPLAPTVWARLGPPEDLRMEVPVPRLPTPHGGPHIVSRVPLSSLVSRHRGPRVSLARSSLLSWCRTCSPPARDLSGYWMTKLVVMSRRRSTPPCLAIFTRDAPLQGHGRSSTGGGRPRGTRLAAETGRQTAHYIQ